MGGGGGGKGGGGSDRSAELYAQQQADLARQKAETEEKERLARKKNNFGAMNFVSKCSVSATCFPMMTNLPR